MCRFLLPDGLEGREELSSTEVLLSRKKGGECWVVTQPCLPRE